MKFRISFFCICVLYNNNYYSILGNPVQETLTLPKGLKDIILDKTIEKLQRSDVIPNLPSPLRLNDTTLSLDSESAKGTLNLVDTVATGLNSLVDDVNLNLITMKVAASLTIPSKVVVSGNYNLEGKVNPADEEDSTSVSGSGLFKGTVTNLNIGVDAKLDIGLLSGKVSISNMDLQVSYDSIAIDAENFQLNDETVDWESVNTELNENFDSVWSQYQEPLVVALTEALNELLSESTISDLVDVFQGKKSFEQLIKLGKGV